MKTCLLSLLFLTGLGWAEPRLFEAAEPVQGHVLLVAEDGQEEALALARCGFDCGLSHATTVQEVNADLSWMRHHFPLESHLSEEASSVKLTVQSNLDLIGLSSKAPLVWQTKKPGVLCLDPQADPARYPAENSVQSPAGVTTLRELPYESSLKPAEPLFLVAPDATDEICQQLKGNVHRAAGSLAEDNSALQKEVRRWLAIQQPLAVVGLPDTKFVASPNWGVRSVGDRIDTLVVHSTVINTLEGTERAFWDDKQRRVSAHYVVDRDGTTVQMVDERRTAWHAGVSELDGRTGVNDFSVGIELVNLNDGKDPYPDAQYQAVARILQDLRTRWDVPDSRVVSHAAIARPVGRKSDPVGFDFAKLLQLLK